jgi:hypothetical protein
LEINSVFVSNRCESNLLGTKKKSSKLGWKFQFFEEESLVVSLIRSNSRLGVLRGFSPISLHDLLCVAGDGFRSLISCFLLLGLPIVCSICTLGCGLLFGLWSFLFSSLLPL